MVTRLININDIGQIYVILFRIDLTEISSKQVVGRDIFSIQVRLTKTGKKRKKEKNRSSLKSFYQVLFKVNFGSPFNLVIFEVYFGKRSILSNALQDLYLKKGYILSSAPLFLKSILSSDFYSKVLTFRDINTWYKYIDKGFFFY